MVSHSVFWSATYNAASFLRFLGPVVFLLAALRWLSCERSLPAWLALVGALLSLGGMLTHHYVSKVEEVFFGAPQPVEGQNPLVFLLFLEGQYIGYGLLSVAVLWHFLKLSAASNQSLERSRDR